MEQKELTALIKKKSKEGKQEVEEMLKHPLSQKQIKSAIQDNKKADEMMEFLKEKGNY